jgi:A/G-specific adenine glycosylase
MDYHALLPMGTSALQRLPHSKGSTKRRRKKLAENGEFGPESMAMTSGFSNFVAMKRISEKAIATFAPTLLDWYREHGRDLPWRHSRDPYAIWLSEVIMQQTRISQGMDYWRRFMDHYPTVDELARASEDDVLRLWQGLGYYSRARHLHEAAQQIVALGHFPSTFAELRQLSGVGDYTAAAVASFAFGERVAAVDGNAYRVMARVFGISLPINSTEGKKAFATLAQRLIAPASDPADFNQAMMDMGATLCTPQSPGCTDCPFSPSCRALAQNAVGKLPVKLKKGEVKTRRMHYIYIVCQGHTAIHRRPAGDIWQGLWEPLLTEGDEPLPSIDGDWKLVCKDMKHVLTHRILLADLYRVETRERPSLPDGFIWVPEEDLSIYARPKLVERLEEEMG